MVLNDNYELVSDGEAVIDFQIDGESWIDEDYVIDGEAGVVISV